MADINSIVNVDITRETLSASSGAFGTGAVIAEFIPGNLNTAMQGDTGRYKIYTSLKVMGYDGWSETDSVYLAARTYFAEKGSPKKFFVGLKKVSDDTWTDALNAIYSDNQSNWYGFSCLLSSTDYDDFNAVITEISNWTEGKVKLFVFSTAQRAALGELVLLTSGTFTSGKLGSLANFQSVKRGQLTISKDDATAVVVTNINLSTGATAGEWETGSVENHLSNFKAITDGELTVNMDAGADVDISGLDFSEVTDMAGVASVIQAGVRLGTGLSGVNVLYNSTVKKMIFQSATTGAASAMVISAVDPTVGTDITGEDYLDGGTGELGQDAAVVDSYADVATVVSAAIVAAGITGVAVAYDSTALTFVFTSDTTGYDSAIDLAEVSTQIGEELMSSSYFNSGTKLYGTDLGATPEIDDIGTIMLALGADRTGWMYHESARDADHVDLADQVWPEFAWMAQIFGNYEPAEANWAYKNFDDNDYMSVSEINDEQHEFVIARNGNTYTYTGGQNVTLFGTVSSGEKFDIMRGTDWLKARLIEAAYKPLWENPKVAFTDQGIGLEETQVNSVLVEASKYLIVGDSIEVTVPLAEDISKVDKAARELTGIEFTAEYQGAINKVSIEGFIGL